MASPLELHNMNGDAGRITTEAQRNTEVTEKNGHGKPGLRKTIVSILSVNSLFPLCLCGLKEPGRHVDSESANLTSRRGPL